MKLVRAQTQRPRKRSTLWGKLETHLPAWAVLEEAHTKPHKNYISFSNLEKVQGSYRRQYNLSGNNVPKKIIIHDMLIPNNYLKTLFHYYLFHYYWEVIVQEGPGPTAPSVRQSWAPACCMKYYAPLYVRLTRPPWFHPLPPGYWVLLTRLSIRTKWYLWQTATSLGCFWVAPWSKYCLPKDINRTLVITKRFYLHLIHSNHSFIYLPCPCHRLCGEITTDD